MSQVEMAYNILELAGKALHISQIIEEIERVFGVALDRESLVSALTKRVLRNDRFVRTGKNTFSLKNE
jgi:DNA-directed RNA polymerase delta subunit